MLCYFKMWKVLSTYIILQLLYLNSGVESLNGPAVIAARYGEFPYTASLQHHPSGDRFCTATLVSKQYVITVAHCIKNERISGVRIVFQVASLPETVKKYALDFWLTYDTWADTIGNVRKERLTHDIAVIKLEERVNQQNVVPIRLNTLNHKQVKGKKATITGWNGQDLLKSFVKILSDEECQRHIRLITNENIEIGPRVLCTAAVPQVLLDRRDGGAPILHNNDNNNTNTLLGVSIGLVPTIENAYTNYSEDFLQRYQVNLHVSVDYYWDFIVRTTEYH